MVTMMDLERLTICMYEACYVSKDRNYGVEISITVLNEIFELCKNAKNHETGGILIGAYSDDMRSALIKYASKAPVDSKSGRASFRRGSKGLIELLNSKWTEAGEYYLGEWHFHPNSSPMPSRTDIQQMNEFSRNKRLKCPEPVLLVVGGNERIGWSISIHIFKNKEMIELF